MTEPTDKKKCSDCALGSQYADVCYATPPHVVASYARKSESDGFCGPSARWFVKRILALDKENT
jgi:hypothetical protein